MCPGSHVITHMIGTMSAEMTVTNDLRLVIFKMEVPWYYAETR